MKVFWALLVGACLAGGLLPVAIVSEHLDEAENQDQDKQDMTPAAGGNSPWMDLTMKLNDSGMIPDKVSELNIEFRYENDEIPPSKMTILEPNITWGGNGAAQNVKFTVDQQMMSQQMNGKDANITYDNSSLIIPTMKASPSTEAPNTQESQDDLCPKIEKIVEELTNRKFMLKGDKGDPAEIPEHLMQLDLSQLKGERGPPGFCSPNECSSGDKLETGWPPFPQPTPSHRYPVPPKSLYKIVPGALVFPNRRAMLQMREFSFVGTVAFVESDQIYYGRVENGWRSFMMGSHVHRSSAPASRTFGSETASATVRLEEQIQRSPESVTRPVNSLRQRGNDYKRHEATQNTRTMAQKTMSSIPMNDGPDTETRYSPSVSSQYPEQTPSSKENVVREKNSHIDGSRTFTLSHQAPVQNILLKTQRLITLNSLQSGNMGGINQLNYQCQRQALKANVLGFFKALLDMSSVTINESNQQLTIVNLLNETLFTLNEETADGRLSAPVYSFGGRMIIPVSRGSRLAWMASDDHESTCHGWTSSSPEDTGTVFNISSPRTVPSNEHKPMKQPCNSTNVVYCLEILPLAKTHLRHFGNPSKNGGHHKPRLSFEKYLSMLRSYDKSSKDSLLNS